MKKLQILLVPVLTLLLHINLLGATTFITNVNVEPTVTLGSAETATANERTNATLLRNFSKENAEMIAFFAHPSSTYLYSSIEISGNVAYIKIAVKDIWGERYNMITKVWVNSRGYIGGIRIIKDDDPWPAFTATSIIKGAVDDALRENSSDPSVSKARQVTEQILNETYYQWDGKDLCLFMTNVMWVSDGYHRYF